MDLSDRTVSSRQPKNTDNDFEVISYNVRGLADDREKKQDHEFPEETIFL